METVQTNQALARKQGADNLKIKKSRSKGDSGRKFLELLQGLGKALQFPIAILPFAAILNRFGALGITYSTVNVNDVVQITNAAGYWISFIIQQPGAIVFNNLPLFFALGCAFGLAKENRGEVTIVALGLYLAIVAMTAEHGLPQMIYGHVNTFNTFNKDGSGAITGTFSNLFYVPVIDPHTKIVTSQTYVFNIGVFGGIFAGCMAAYFYNHLREIKLPNALAFFSGRRFVPMVALAASIPLSLLFAIIWPWIQYALIEFGKGISNGGDPWAIPGSFFYGIINRLLLPFGLHQILNTFFWFQMPVIGDKIAPITGQIIQHNVTVYGDINAFTSGISSSGIWMTGYFPIMMGGLPAAAIAMIYAAKKENRREVAAFLGGVAGVSFLTGITEPIEFSFVFISPALWVSHAFLTGIFNAVVTAMHIHIGFGFSAGFIDYAISIPQSWGIAASQSGAYHIIGNPLWALLIAVICAAVYFPVFYFLIIKMNIMTPGREETYGTKAVPDGTTSAPKSAGLVDKNDKVSRMADMIIEAVGKDNVVALDNCMTRLRFTLKDNSIVDPAKIKASGAYGMKKIGSELLQVVIGLQVEFVANAIREKLNVTGKLVAA